MLQLSVIGTICQGMKTFSTEKVKNGLYFTIAASGKPNKTGEYDPPVYLKCFVYNNTAEYVKKIGKATVYAHGDFKVGKDKNGKPEYYLDIHSIMALSKKE